MLEHVRRLFPNLRLLILLLILGCALADNRAASQTPKDKHGKPLKIGLQLYSVREDCAKDLPATLESIAEMGYTGVEFAGYYGRSADEIRKLLVQDKLACYGTHVDINAITGDNLEKTIAYCKTIGCKFIVVPWLPEDRRNSKASTIATAHFFTETAAKTKAAGIILGWHNEDYEFKEIDGATIWETFWANAGNDVAMEFDTGNALAAGVQAAPYLVRYPKHVQSIHVKDHSETNKNALLGEGDEHWNEVIPILKNKLSPKWFIIEQESYGEPPLVCVNKCLQNFRKLWATY